MSVTVKIEREIQGITIKTLVLHIPILIGVISMTLDDLE